MGDFGFYLEHSEVFRNYLKKQFGQGKKIEKFSDFCALVNEFTINDRSVNEVRLSDEEEGRPVLIVFGVCFTKVCDVELDEEQGGRDEGRHYSFASDTIAATTEMHDGGAYIWCFNDIPKYIGGTCDLANRIKDYSKVKNGNIGQSTNKRLNEMICAAIREGKRVTLYFYPTAYHYHDIKQYLLRKDNERKGRTVFIANWQNRQ